jgi:phage terminase small subunit
MALTPKQQRFVEEYIVDLNCKQAAIRAGYSERTAEQQGSRLLSNVKVAQVINEALVARSERTKIDADYVLSTILDTIERCKQAKPVCDRTGKQVMVETEDGELAPAYSFDSKAVLRGCELLGKHLALFTDKHEVTGADGGPVEITVVPVRPAHEDSD